MFFCSADDVQVGMPVQAASRFNGKYDDYRKEASQSIKNFTRRNWDYDATKVEYFDSEELCANDQKKIYLEKRPVDLTVPFDVRFSYDRVWDSSTLLTSGTDYTWDADQGCLIIYNLYRIKKSHNPYRIQYAAGLKPLNSTDVYDTSVGDYDILRSSCIAEAVDRMRNFLNMTTGEQDTVGKNRERIHVKPRVGGLLSEVARNLEPYRRLYMRAI